ncbi:hypothetical protein D3C77_688600 [compost metagenome]
MLLINLQVDSQRQLVIELFIQLIEQLTAHIDNFIQRIKHVTASLFLTVRHQFVDEVIALEQLIALLVDLKLLQP